MKRKTTVMGRANTRDSRGKEGYGLKKNWQMLRVRRESSKWRNRKTDEINTQKKQPADIGVGRSEGGVKYYLYLQRCRRTQIAVSRLKSLHFHLDKYFMTNTV